MALAACVAVIVFALGIIGAVLGCAQTAAPLTRVDPYVWRSGQPQTVADWQAIKANGVTDVVKLNYDGEGSDALGASMGLRIHVLPLEPRGDQDVFDDLANTFKRPDSATVALIDAELAHASPGRVYLIHCRWGHDRTGWIAGRYLVLRGGWTKDQAYAYMLKNGFHASLHGLNDAWEDWKP